MSLSDFVKSTGAEGLKKLFVEILNLGNPDFNHLRTKNRIGLSDPRACPRKRQWMIEYGEIVEWDSSLSLVVGSAIHMYCQDLISKYFRMFFNKTLFIERSVKIDMGNGCEANSWIDIYFDADKPEDRVVIDIKTTSKTEENYKNNTLPENSAQLNAYMGAVGAKKGYLVVFYLNKNYDKLENSIEVIEVAFDRKLYDEVISDIKNIFQSIREKKLAKTKFGRTDCAYCPFKLVCDEFWRFLTEEIKNPYIRKDYNPDIQYIMNQIVYTPGFAEKTDDRNVIYNLNFQNINKARENLLKRMKEVNDRE